MPQGSPVTEATLGWESFRLHWVNLFHITVVTSDGATEVLVNSQRGKKLFNKNASLGRFPTKWSLHSKARGI